MVRTTIRSLVVVAAVAGGFLAVPTPASADPTGGTLRKVETVSANTTDVYTITMRGGEMTRIRVQGDGDTCLELRVYDENGNLVASDTLGSGDRREARVTPKWTGPFKVKIMNRGSVGNRYVIVAD